MATTNQVSIENVNIPGQSERVDGDMYEAASLAQGMTLIGGFTGGTENKARVPLSSAAGWLDFADQLPRYPEFPPAS